MQPTAADGIFTWSAWQPDRNLSFNSCFVVADGGNIAIDPLPLSDEGAQEIEKRGGLAWVVVTNRDHERATAGLIERFAAKVATSELDAPLLTVPVARTLRDGDEIGGGFVIALDGLKTAGEFALHFRKQRAVVVGDALVGDPAGRLRLMPDSKLADPPRAALSLRRVAAVWPEHLLVGDGACIYGGAKRAIWDCLEARTDAFVNRINTGEVEWREDPPDYPAVYTGGASSDLDFMIGAERLGYRLARIPPGKAFCPLHWHSAEEELFVILEGEITLLTPRGEWLLRKGDFVNFPTRPSGAHKVVNRSAGPCEILMIANVDEDDVCYYPDSKKVLVEKTDLMLRDHPVLDYFDGE